MFHPVLQSRKTTGNDEMKDSARTSPIQPSGKARTAHAATRLNAASATVAGQKAARAGGTPITIATQAPFKANNLPFNPGHSVRGGSKHGSSVGTEHAMVQELPSTMGLDLADFTANVSDLEKMRTFPSLVPLPDLDGDLEFLDFFDPLLGLPPKHVEAFALPSLDMDGWSPLENFSASSQTSMQDYGFHALPPDDSPAIDVASPFLGVANRTTKPRQQSFSWAETPAPSPAARPVVFKESMRAHLQQDLTTRLLPEQLASFRLPTAAALQKCIRTYIDAFHFHLPIFLFPTIDSESTPLPPILGNMCHWRQYRLERKVSASMYLEADQRLAAAVVNRGDHLHKELRLVEDWVRPGAQSRRSMSDTLWKSQTRLLLACSAVLVAIQKSSPKLSCTLETSL